MIPLKILTLQGVKMLCYSRHVDEKQTQHPEEPF